MYESIERNKNYCEQEVKLNIEDESETIDQNIK